MVFAENLFLRRRSSQITLSSRNRVLPPFTPKSSPTTQKSDKPLCYAEIFRCHSKIMFRPRI